VKFKHARRARRLPRILESVLAINPGNRRIQPETGEGTGCHDLTDDLALSKLVWTKNRRIGVEFVENGRLASMAPKNQG
jgi:hypothetical protein